MRLFRVLRISSAGNTPQCPVPVCPSYGPVPFNDKPDHPATQNGACRYPRVRLRVQLLHNSRTFCPTSAPTYGICMWVDSRGTSGLGMRYHYYILPLLLPLCTTSYTAVQITIANTLTTSPVLNPITPPAPQTPTQTNPYDLVP